MPTGMVLSSPSGSFPELDAGCRGFNVYHFNAGALTL